MCGVGFDPTGFEGYAEPPMNPGGRQDLIENKAYISGVNYPGLEA